MCKTCQTKPVYEFTNKRKLCKTCFIKWFHKRVFYTIRKFKMIKKGEKIAYMSNYGFRDVVLEDILELIRDRVFVKIVRLSLIKSKKKVDKIAISSTLDSEAREIVELLIKGKADKKQLKELHPIQKENNKMIIKPLYLFLDKEVLLYAKLKKLQFKEIKEKKDGVIEFIDDLEKKHPEIKRAVVNSYLELFGNDSNKLN